jgi:hypothetical protein
VVVGLGIWGGEGGEDGHDVVLKVKTGNASLDWINLSPRKCQSTVRTVTPAQQHVRSCQLTHKQSIDFSLLTLSGKVGRCVLIDGTTIAI